MGEIIKKKKIKFGFFFWGGRIPEVENRHFKKKIKLKITFTLYFIFFLTPKPREPGRETRTAIIIQEMRIIIIVKIRFNGRYLLFFSERLFWGGFIRSQQKIADVAGIYLNTSRILRRKK